MQVWSLSSGSSGNCYLVKEGNTLLLLDAGISARRVERELAQLGFSTSQLSGILVSHEHVDHWQAAVTLARRSNAPVVCTQGTWQAGADGTPLSLHLPVRPVDSLKIGELAVEAFPVPHDARETVGFQLRSWDSVLCLATDIGTMTDEVLERSRAADLVILESNHDVEMVVRGPYPQHLKARILGDRGHLSNEAAARALVEIARGRPKSFWLAHLSHTNNSPRVALRSVQTVLRREGLESLDVAVALRDRRSLFWDSEAIMSQLPLFSL